MIWRLVGRKGSLVEIETEWTLKDLFDAHEIMDVEAEAERYAVKKASGGK